MKLTGIPSISPQEITDRILNLFKLIYAPLLAGVLSSCKLIIPVSDTQITASMLKIMGILTSQTSFVERIHDKETKVDENKEKEAEGTNQEENSGKEMEEVVHENKEKEAAPEIKEDDAKINAPVSAEDDKKNANEDENKKVVDNENSAILLLIP